MKKLFLKIFCLLFLLAPLAGRAANVDLQLQVTPATPAGPTGGSGATSGGGGGPESVPSPSTIINGWTSPNAFVEAIVGNQVIATAIAKGDGSFSIKSILDGTRTTYLRSTDVMGNVATLTQPITLIAGSNVSVDNVVLPPTVAFSQLVISQGELISGTGRTIPGSVVSLVLTGAVGQSSAQLINANGTGTFIISLASKTLPLGSLFVQTAINFNGKSASLSYNLTVVAPGKAVVPPAKTPAGLPASCVSAEDFNCDGKVNLQDISILLAYYGQPNAPKKYDLNNDGKINLIDFSIMLFYYNKPIKAALVSGLTAAMVGDAVPPTVTLDIGAMPDGKTAAVFSAADAQTDVASVDISLDRGRHWRPAESPYLLGAANPNDVQVRAIDEAGNTEVARVAPVLNYYYLALGALAGALLAAFIIFLHSLMFKPHA